MNQPTQVYAREFDQRLAKFSPDVQRRIEDRITEMSSRLDTFPHHRLTGSNCYRLRVGDYRVIYSFDLPNGLAHLITVGHRREVYRSR